MKQIFVNNLFKNPFIHNLNDQPKNIADKKNAQKSENQKITESFLNMIRLEKVITLFLILKYVPCIFPLFDIK